MMLKKEASKKNSPGEGKRGNETVLTYDVFPADAIKSDDEYRLGPTQAGQIGQINLRLEYAEKKASNIASQLAEKTNELERLRKYVMQLEEGEKGLIHELAQQLSIKDEEISRIASLYAKKEAENRKLSSELSVRINSQRDYTEKIKTLLIKKEEETTKLIEGLRKELEKKNTEVTSLRNSLSENVNSTLRIPDASPHSKQTELLQKELEEKNKEMGRLERGVTEDQKLNQSIQLRLKEQVAETKGQMEELKSFLIEKEKLVQSLGAAFEKRLAAKDEETRQLKNLSQFKPETILRKQIDDLKSELLIKEEATKGIAEEITNLKEQSNMLRQRLEERHRMFAESEKAYEEVIANLREQHEARTKALVQESAQKEAALKAAIETERAKIWQETFLMKEKGKQIEETLHTFAKTSQELIKLGSSTAIGEPEESELNALKTELVEKQKQLEEKEKTAEDMLAEKEMKTEEQEKQLAERQSYVEKKETEVKKLLRTTETKITELKEKESAIETREKLLLKEQEAVAKELEVLINAGSEISRSKHYLKQKLEHVEDEERKRYLESKERQVKGLLASADRKIAELKTKDEIIERRELLLLKEQEAINKELEMLRNAEQEIAKSKQFLQQKLAEMASQQRITTSPELTITKPIATVKRGKQLSKKLKKATTTKTRKITVAKVQPKPQRQLPQPKQQITKQMQQPETELFTDLQGYSELDEVKSVIEIGLQHGDSIEQIKQSLIASGYSQKTVEKVLSGFQK